MYILSNETALVGVVGVVWQLPVVITQAACCVMIFVKADGLVVDEPETPYRSSVQCCYDNPTRIVYVNEFFRFLIFMSIVSGRHCVALVWTRRDCLVQVNENDFILWLSETAIGSVWYGGYDFLKIWYLCHVAKFPSQQLYLISFPRCETA